MPFTYDRTIYFRDTDAAGVVYFANVLSMCHEAYEASLAASGIDLRAFFQAQSIALPIVHAAIDFSKPMFCGEQYTIQVSPTQLTESKFQITYQIALRDKPEYQSSQATTLHLCIDAVSRSRRSFPPDVLLWLQSFSVLND
jgi:1,4-dihydroxy-2-naphthoyl-CoA hydrolase